MYKTHMHLKPIAILKIVFVYLISAEPLWARTVDRTAAIIGNQVITLSDVWRFQKNLSLRKELDPFLALNLLPKNQKETTLYLVQEALITKKFKVSDSEVETNIKNVLKKNQIDKATLKEILKSQGTAYNDYRRLMRLSLAKQKLIEQELRPMIKVTEDSLISHYHTESRKNKKKRKAPLIYNISQMQVPNQLLAKAIMKRLKNGESFESVAAEFSEENVQIIHLGDIQEDSLTTSARSALAGLKSGQYTSPLLLKSTSILQIIKVNKITTLQGSTFEKSKGKIYSVLYKKAIRKQLDLWVEKQKKTSFVHIPSY